MIKKKKMTSILNEIKPKLHPRNEFNVGYDFEKLIANFKPLEQFVFTNKFETKTINFADANAVKALNTGILKAYYNIKWEIPNNNLCPPIPGRADYLHYIADLINLSNDKTIPIGKHVIGLDIGVGANCIYPILGSQIYNWQFVGTDIDNIALENCVKIIENNQQLNEFVSLQLQTESKHVFKNIIAASDKFTFTMCNPPFHDSLEQAKKSTTRKINGLKIQDKSKFSLNFGGKNNELWTAGGELSFIKNMIYESIHYSKQVLWFTTLVSQKKHLNSLQKTLKKVDATVIKVIDMAQGNKVSRILAWSFITNEQRKIW